MRRGSTSRPASRAVGLGPAVGIDPAHHDVDTLLTPVVRCFKHGVRFANTRRGTKEDLEFAAALLGVSSVLHAGEQDVGIGPLIMHTYRSSRYLPRGARPERTRHVLGDRSRVPQREA